MLEEVVLPVARERKLPFAMMIGSRLQVNPGLRDGGDMLGLSDVLSVVNLCRKFEQSGVKFDSPYKKDAQLGIYTAYFTDPWGTFIELTEGLSKL